jgi:hypothetical protein
MTDEEKLAVAMRHERERHERSIRPMTGLIRWLDVGHEDWWAQEQRWRGQRKIS